MRAGQRYDRPEPARAHVTILLATRDGAAHLEPQLDSIAAQSHRDWSLIVSDDGSTDATCAMVERFARQQQNPVTLLQGPGRGSAENFLFLMRQWAALAPPGAWMAFADQDDVWLADKIARAVARLAPLPAGSPALYCSRSWVCDTGLANRRLSAPRPRAPGFSNALVQNIAAGNTIVLPRPPPGWPLRQRRRPGRWWSMTGGFISSSPAAAARCCMMTGRGCCIGSIPAT